MAAESKEGSDAQQELVTSSFYVMKIFKFDIFQMRKMPVSTFNMLLKEIEKDNKLQETEMNKSNNKTMR